MAGDSNLNIMWFRYVDGSRFFMGIYGYWESAVLRFFNSSRLTDLENELMVAGGRESYGLWEGYVHTVTFTMDNQQGPIV